MKKGNVTDAASKSFSERVRVDFRRNCSLYLLVIPVILFYLIFHYKPMIGAVIAFQDYIPRKGISGSEWVGFEQFIRFFQSPILEGSCAIPCC